MSGTPQQCPRCGSSVLVFETADMRTVPCPHCKILLRVTSDSIELLKRQSRRPRPVLDSPPPTPLPDPSAQGLGLVVAAFSFLGVLVIGAGIAGVMLYGQTARREAGALVSELRPKLAATKESETTQSSADANQGNESRTNDTKKRGEAGGTDLDYMPSKSSPLGSSVSVSELPESLATVVERVRHAVATIEADGQGSGFIVGRRRWLATNLHVIAGSSRARAFRKTADGEDETSITIAGFVACDPVKDLVILALEKDWPAEPLSLSVGTPRLGEDVFAVGTPKGLTETVTRGIVSQVRSAAELGTETLAPTTKIIQTDAFVTYGSSGGPLCLATGKVIGVNTFVQTTESDSVEFHFAVAAEELAQLVGKASGSARPLHELPRPRD